MAGVLSENDTVLFGFNSGLELDVVGIEGCDDDLALEPLKCASVYKTCVLLRVEAAGGLNSGALLGILLSIAMMYCQSFQASV